MNKPSPTDIAGLAAAANPVNPRKITKSELDGLKKALREYGDLGGIIYNILQRMVDAFKVKPVRLK